MHVKLREHFDIKTEILGPKSEKDCVDQIKVLNRIVTWEAEGITWEPDPRHAELVIEQLGLTGGKPLKLPGAKEPTRRDKQSIEELEAEVASVHAALMAEGSGLRARKTCTVVTPEAGRVASEQSRSQFMESDGWEHNGENGWTKSFNMVSRMPMPEVLGIRRRVVRDIVYGVLLEDY